MKYIKNKLSLLLVFLMAFSFNISATVSADDEPFYGNLLSPEVSACESQAAVNAFANDLAQPRQIDTTEFHSGTGSVKVSVSSANVSYAGFTPSAPLVEGALYRFSIWYKDSRETPTGRLQLRARAGMGTYILSNNNDYATSGGNFVNSGYQSIRSGWNKYEVLFYPTNAMLSSDFSYFYLTSDSAETRYMYFDDMVFERVSPYDAMLMSEVSDCESNYATSSVNLLLNDGSGLADSGKVRTISTTYKHSGDGSLAITSSTDTYLALFSFRQKEEIVAGETYCFSMWYNDPDSAAGSSNFEFVVRSKSNAGQSLITRKLSSGSGWQKYIGYFTVPAAYASSNFDYFYVRASGFKSGTIYFDDIKLRKVDENEIYYGSGLIDAEIAACDSDGVLSTYNINTLNYAGTRSISTSVSHSGTGSLQVTSPVNWQTAVGVVPLETLVDGQQYHFSVWYYNPGNLSGNLYLRYVYGNNTSPAWIGSGSTTANETKKPLGSGWQKYEYTFTATGANMTTNLTYLFVTSDVSASGTLYFDDISLTKVPSALTVCTTDDLGEVAFGTPMELSFSGEIDTGALPSNAVIDGESLVEIYAEAADGEHALVTLVTPVADGEHTLTITFSDLWGRSVTADVSFSSLCVELINSDVSACESTAALTMFNTYRVGAEARTLDYTNYHGGTGSVKVSVTSDNLSYISIKPAVGLTEGQRYYFSVWYYDTRETAAGNLKLRGRTESSDSAILMEYTAKAIRVGAWSKFDCIFEADEALANDLSYFYITSDSNSARYMYFDDITFIKYDYENEYSELVDSGISACESTAALTMFNTYKVGAEARALDNTNYHSGEGSVKVSVTSDNLSYISIKPTSELIEGEVYRFSVWYYDTGTGTGGNLVLRGRTGSNTPILLNKTAHPIKSGEWVKYECTFEADYDLSSNLSFLYLTSDLGETRYIYFDDIVLRKVNPYLSMVDPYVSTCESDYALSVFNENKISTDDVTRTVDYTCFHSGTGSLKVILDGGYKAYVGIKPVVGFVEGNTYHFSAWYYNPEGIEGTMYLRYAYPNKDSIGNWITGTDTATTDTGRPLESGWSKYDITFTAKEDMASSSFKYLYLTVDAASGILYFDDISLQRVLEDTTVLQSVDIENGEKVECDRSFVYTFNHEISEASLPQINVSLSGTTRYDAQMQLSSDMKTLTVSFLNRLERGKDYSLSIKNVYDLWGRRVNIETVSFKTIGDFEVECNIYNVVDGQRVDFSGDLSERTDVVVNAANNTLESKSFVLCLAEYKGTRLVDVCVSDRETLGAGMSSQTEMSLNSPDGDKIRLFVFDDMNNLNPIMPAVDVFPTDGKADSLLGAGYLVDDIWTSTTYDSVLRPSGWDVDRSGGRLKTASGAFVAIEDTDSSNPVSMEKVFSHRAENNVTVETAFKLSSSTDKLTVKVSGGDKAALKLLTKDSYICYEDENDTNKVLGSCSANQYIGLKAVFDIVNKNVAIYINGSLCKTASFKEDAAYIDRLSFETSSEGTMTAQIGFVKVYENYIINESFQTTAEGASPDGFVTEGNVEAFVEANVSSNTDKYLKLSGNASGLRADFEGKTSKLYGGFKFLLKNSSSGISVNLGDGITLNAENGMLYCNNSPVYSYTENIWYQADYEIDMLNDCAIIKLNGKTLLPGLSYAGSSSFNSIEFSAAGEVWLDDITVYDKFDDYSVPEVRSLDEDDYLIGMQTYFMWHEGTHYGWDKITPFPERKPYLGWYTDGSPEVSDWEIKWMLEHGIDYEIFPWARNETNKNAAIKRPIRSDALHDGYFNAKNSDEMKFALMWSMISSSTLGGSADFRNNIVPYWLEYYFNDPRYLLIDNKPFLSVYDYGNLVSVLGSEAAVKAEFDYLRDACINAGFDGIYLVIITGETDSSEEFSRIQGLGADAIYPYHWFYGSNTANYQIESIRRQIANSPTDVIPYVSMGWNPQPWLGMPGEFCSLENYETALRYSKERVDALKQSGDIDHKMVIVGNWNEYGEGHFVMPSNVAGFGYLDKIRKVFSGGDDVHVDDVPTEAQIESMGYLYRQDRIGERYIPEPTDISDYTTVLKSWEFNSWTSYSEWEAGSVTGLSSFSGVLKGTSTGNDPIVRLKNDINLDITDADYVKIRMRLKNSASCSASIMFKTQDNPEWGGGKYVSFGVYNEDYYDYYVYMKSNSRWSGVLTNVRIDPMESKGTFEIDSIQILKKTN